MSGRAPTRVDEALLEQHEFRPVAEDRPGRDVVSCGRAEEYTVRIVDPATREVLPAGRVGEIWLRGPSVAQGYWDREEATAEAFGVSTLDGDTGYVRTGDLGTLHDGEIYVTGRLKEMLILRGRNIYPQDVEHGLRHLHPELVGLFGAAFAVPVAGADGADGATEEQLVVVHEVRGSVGADELPRLAARVRGGIARDFSVRPAAVALVRRGAVLGTTSGKIQRAAMRAQYLDGLMESRHLDGPPAA
ncbi:AMP-binding protein [Streptomyces sp. CA-179760]|uniref:AMP-binding protein n=1 Tax=Streptomyces sp. CA-179760 TaxID=3240054 RepID=UPI003D8FC5BC